MKQSFLRFCRVTLVGGITFLLPIVIMAWLLKKAMQMAAVLAKPALALLPPGLTGGVLINALETLLILLIVAFAAGLMARTGIGQRFMIWVENSLIGSLPQFSFVRGIADEMDGSDDRHVEVVLVPADAGWAIGLVFVFDDQPFVPVFLPGAPQWTSGSVVIAERAKMRPAGISLFEATKIMQRLGQGADGVVKTLAKG